MAGYNGYSMSNNAARAYDDGMMPLSKWTKAEILERCGEKAEILSALTVAELRKELLCYSEWHHTSNHFNRTDFFAVDEDRLEDITSTDVQRIIEQRVPASKQEKEQPKQITAEITYTVWEGRYRNYRRPKDYTETVTYFSTDKMIDTQHGGRKRLASLKNVKIIEEV